MNFISTVCPHCGKELQVPEGAEHLVCMYCTRPIEGKPAPAGPADDSEETYERLMAQAESLLKDEIFSAKIEMRDLKQSNYDKLFEEYQAALRPALQAYSLAATESGLATDRFAEVLFGRFIRQLEQDGVKKESDYRFFDCRYRIVAFTIPAILELHTPAADALADRFLEIWNKHYPKNRLGKSDYESISGGFRKKLCFITTAVCSSLGKADDCAELGAFRSFRDGWLAQTPDGRAKIREYYLFAPMIVREIDRSPQKDAVYREIWESSLAPCLNKIETGDFAACARQYEEMVLFLEQKWLN